MAIRAISTSASTAFDIAREGMERGERKLSKAADLIAKGDSSPNLIIELANAETMYGANAKVIQAHDEMLGTLLNVKG